MHCDCVRCGYGWESRIEERPRNCPACKSPVWDRPKVSYREAEDARRAVRESIRRGNITRQPCEICGTTKDVQAHHEDYSKPLDVRWLCRKHHHARHKEIGGKWAKSNPNARTILITPELWAALKSDAALAGKTLTEYINELLVRARTTR